jgi:rhodanese-related sulfurtransferase
MNDILLWVAVATIGFLALKRLGWLGGGAAGIASLGPEAARERLGREPRVLLVDVRGPKEHRQGHLPHALLVPLDQLHAQAAQALPDPSATVLLYCQSGVRSLTAAKRLKKMGYTDVINLAGGIAAWSRTGYPVVSD